MTGTETGKRPDEDAASGDALRCRRCGAPVTEGLVATSLRHCCLSPSGVAGVCPEHGVLALSEVVEA